MRQLQERGVIPGTLAAENELLRELEVRQTHHRHAREVRDEVMNSKAHQEKERSLLNDRRSSLQYVKPPPLQPERTGCPLVDPTPGVPAVGAEVELGRDDRAGHVGDRCRNDEDVNQQHKDANIETAHGSPDDHIPAPGDRKATKSFHSPLHGPDRTHSAPQCRI